MLQVSRDSNLKIPKKIENVSNNVNTLEDKVAVKQAFATAENSGCILKKQYKQISLQLSEAINLIAAWKKSDDERWKKRN